MEEWRPVVGHEGYEVSDLGRVRSLTRTVTRAGRNCKDHTMKRQGQMLRPGVSSSGHYIVHLGHSRARTVHSLVLAAFVGPRPDGGDVRHLNADKLDNRLENICYGTRGDNVRDMKYHAGRNGFLHVDQILEIKRLIAAGVMQKRIAAQFGVCRDTIRNIKYGYYHSEVVEGATHA